MYVSSKFQGYWKQGRHLNGTSKVTNFPPDFLFTSGHLHYSLALFSNFICTFWLSAGYHVTEKQLPSIQCTVVQEKNKVTKSLNLLKILTEHPMVIKNAQKSHALKKRSYEFMYFVFKYFSKTCFIMPAISAFSIACKGVIANLEHSCISISSQ